MWRCRRCDGDATDVWLMRAASQRWYVFQAPVGDDPNRYDQFDIYLRRGGVFDDPTATEIDVVGTGSLRFDSGLRAVLVYEFTSGDNAGLSGSVDLVRLGSAPPGCRE